MTTNNGWHGDHLKRGIYADSQTDPRTGQPASGRGWSKTTTAQDRFKKWAKGKSKEQIRKAKKDIKRVQKEHESARARQKRLEHDRELRRTRKQRMAQKDVKSRSNKLMKDRRQAEEQSHIIPCKWCGQDFNLNTWKHCNGRPCPGPQ